MDVSITIAEDAMLTNVIDETTAMTNETAFLSYSFHYEDQDKAILNSNSDGRQVHETELTVETKREVEKEVKSPPLKKRFIPENDRPLVSKKKKQLSSKPNILILAEQHAMLADQQFEDDIAIVKQLSVPEIHLHPKRPEYLSPEEVDLISMKSELQSQHIDAFSTLLSKKFPHMGGLFRSE